MIFVLVEHRKGLISDVTYKILAKARGLAEKMGTDAVALLLGKDNMAAQLSKLVVDGTRYHFAVGVREGQRPRLGSRASHLHVVVIIVLTLGQESHDGRERHNRRGVPSEYEPAKNPKAGIQRRPPFSERTSAQGG